jgi:hypothetical protein
MQPAHSGSSTRRDHPKRGDPKTPRGASDYRVLSMLGLPVPPGGAGGPPGVYRFLAHAVVPHRTGKRPEIGCAAIGSAAQMPRRGGMCRAEFRAGSVGWGVGGGEVKGGHLAFASSSGLGGNRYEGNIQQQAVRASQVIARS